MPSNPTSLLSFLHADDDNIQLRLNRAAGRWSLMVGEPVTGGFRSNVFAAKVEGRDVVLKVASTPFEGRLEAAALTLWSETGAAVKLIESDAADGSLLLDRIDPATPLSWEDDDVAVAAAAGVLKKFR